MRYTEELVIETHSNLKKLEHFILSSRFFVEAVHDIVSAEDLASILERQLELLEEHERKNG